jgi:hypothetical protein
MVADLHRLGTFGVVAGDIMHGFTVSDGGIQHVGLCSVCAGMTMFLDRYILVMV